MEGLVKDGEGSWEGEGDDGEIRGREGEASLTGAHVVDICLALGAVRSHQAGGRQGPREKYRRDTRQELYNTHGEEGKETEKREREGEVEKKLAASL